MASAYIDDRYYVERDGVKVRTSYAGAKRFRVRWREHPTANQKSQSFVRMEDARAHKAHLEHSLRAGSYIDPAGGRETFGAWWARWRPAKLDLRESSRSRDDGYYRNHIGPALGDVPLSAIDRAMMRTWVAKLSAQGLAPATVRHAVGLVSGAMAVAVEDKLIASNPAYRLRGLPKIEHTEMRIATPDEVATLSAEIDKRYRTWLLTAAYSGLRLGETAALRRNKVDLLRGRITVAASSTEVNGKVVTGQPKTKAGRRTVPIPPALVEVLGQHCEGLAATDLVFTAPEGGVLRRNAFRRRVWVPATLAAGLAELVPAPMPGKPKRVTYQGLRIHDLRHTAVSLWIDNDASIKQLATWAGHTSVATLVDRYGHLLPDNEEPVMASLDHVFRSAKATKTAPVVALDPAAGGASGAGG